LRNNPIGWKLHFSGSNCKSSQQSPHRLRA